MTTKSIEQRLMVALTPHPANARIYGDAADDELVESVRAKGVLSPLLITAKGVVISGHRRLDAARRAGLAAVPVAVFGSADELDILEALLESNRQRTKTGEQMGREYTASKTIEAERAKRRQAAQARINQPQAQKVVKSPPSEPQQATAMFICPLPGCREVFDAPVWHCTGCAHHWPNDREQCGNCQQPRRGRTAAQDDAPKVTGKAGDIAASRIGVNRQKAERAAKVVAAIDTLKEEGREREAEQLRKTLNTGSVNRAYGNAREAGHIPQQPVAPAPAVAGDVLITLPVWQGWVPETRAAALLRSHSARAKFNSQDTDNIEWARWSWNPVTGCKHDCSYCYARDIAMRYYQQGFVPTFLPERLDAPRNTPVPAQAAADIGYRNVFTCSMADLFGRWVPAEWIEAVLDQVRSSPQWNFLFLTKFPIRMQEFDFPDNAWVGTTVDAQARVANAERAFARVKASVKWLSCEPLLEPLRFEHLDLFRWVVIGGASRSTQTPEWRPPRAWIESLERQARDAGCKVYEKTNLLERLREYPGQPEAARISVPDAFGMPYLQRDVLTPSLYAVETEAAAPPPL